MLITTLAWWSSPLALYSRRVEKPPRAPRPPRLSEQPLEEIAELGRAGMCIAAAAELEALVPIGRRAEILPLLPVGAELVVGGALFRILQNLVGLTQFLEFRLGARLLVDIGVKRARQLAIGALDVVLRGVALNAEDLVVVPIFHGA